MRSFTSITLVASLALLAISSTFATAISDHEQQSAPTKNDLPTRPGLKGTMSKRQLELPYVVICNNSVNDPRVQECCAWCREVPQELGQDICLFECYEERGIPIVLPGN